MRQRRSHAPSKATPSSMSAKLRDNQLSIYSIFFEDVWWSLNETTVCSERAEWSTRKLELSGWLSSWREIQSTLELCDKTLGGHCVQAYWWLWVARLWRILQQHSHKRQCSFPLSSLFLTEEPHEQVVHPTPQTSMQTERNPTSQQSPADSQQYKMTTMKHPSIHQLLIKMKTKRTKQQKGSRGFVCCRKSQVKW